MRDIPSSSLFRRFTLLPPPPSDPEVLETIWQNVSWDETECWETGETECDLSSGAPTCWQAPMTESYELQSDDIDYLAIASALRI